MQNRAENLLRQVQHPESGQDIVSGGIVESISASQGRISVHLRFVRARDPFALPIKRQVEQLLAEEFSDCQIAVFIKEGPAPERKSDRKETKQRIAGVKKIIAVSSGKGGVGKSTVTANLASVLTSMGYSTGILDADIYGPSQPGMFGLEGYVPEAEAGPEGELMIPAEKDGVKIMSIGFFIRPDDALIWRGPMATSALGQLIRQTKWGQTDFLLIDMPPGTGDIHLTVVQQLKVDGAVIVTTPQQIAVADARRGIEMFKTEGIDIPVLGIVENMAWFTPAELPDNRYYIFGRGGAESLAGEQGVELLGSVPLMISVMENADSGKAACLGKESPEYGYYRQIAEKIVGKV